MAQCATTALADAVPRLCVRGAHGRFGGFGLVPGVVSLPFPPSRPACPALRVAGRPVRVSLTSLGDPAAWLQEGGEACSSAARVLAGADVAGGEVVEGEAQAFPHRLQKEPGGVREGSFDIKGGNDEVYRVHVGDGVLEEDGLVWGPAWDGP